MVRLNPYVAVIKRAAVMNLQRKLLQKFSKKEEVNDLFLYLNCNLFQKLFCEVSFKNIL